MVFSVKTYNNINQIGLKELGNHFQIDGDLAENPDAYIIRSQNLHDTVFPENLKAIARAGAGTNNIPVDKATEKGIVVFNTPGANANAVKFLLKQLGIFLTTLNVFLISKKSLKTVIISLFTFH